MDLTLAHLDLGLDLAVVDLDMGLVLGHDLGLVGADF